MNILILGAGRVGSASAVELASEQDNEVTVIDIAVSYTHLTLPTKRIV